MPAAARLHAVSRHHESGVLCQLGVYMSQHMQRHIIEAELDPETVPILNLQWTLKTGLARCQLAPARRLSGRQCLQHYEQHVYWRRV